MQRVIESREIAAHVRRTDQFSIQAVGPSVIRAPNTSVERSGGFGAHPGTAVPAHVEQRPDFALLVARNDHALAEYIAQKVIPWFRDLFRPARMNPAAEEEPFHLRAEDLRIGVILGRQGRGVRCGGHRAASRSPSTRLKCFTLRVSSVAL